MNWEFERRKLLPGHYSSTHWLIEENKSKGEAEGQQRNWRGLGGDEADWRRGGKIQLEKKTK
jgi:hypothetical protein